MKKKYSLYYDFPKLFEKLRHLESRLKKTDQPIGEHTDMDDLSAYKSAVSDDRVSVFNGAKKILDELMNSVADGTFSMQLSTLPNMSSDKFDELLMPIFWYSLVRELRPNSETIARVINNCRNETEQRLYRWASIEGECILKLYIVLVHGRDIFRKIIGSCNCKGREYNSIHLLNKFLNCKYIRLIRNSLAHGTFRAFSGGIVFYDQKNTVYASPQTLDMLSDCLNIITLLMI